MFPKFRLRLVTYFTMVGPEARLLENRCYLATSAPFTDFLQGKIRNHKQETIKQLKYEDKLKH